MALERPTTSSLLLHGTLGGGVAGIVFVSAETAMAREFDLEMIAPLRLIATIALGPGALSPVFDAPTAIVVGIFVHLVLSAIYGIAFIYLLAFTRQNGAAPALLVVYGAVFGLALWALNFLTIAPELFPQFTMIDDFWMGFVAHTGGYGVILGAYAAALKQGIRAFVVL